MGSSRLLEQLALSDAQLARIQKRYELVLTAADPWRSESFANISKASLRRSGIYFWVLAHSGALHGVYVGRTNSLGNRLREYAATFQPHSPNDYKLQVFGLFIHELFPAAELTLYFSPCDISELTQREKEEIEFFAPLLNRRMKADVEARRNLQEAFVAYYQSCFLGTLDGT